MIRYTDIHIAYDKVLLEKGAVTLYPGTLALIHGESGIGKSALLYRLSLITEDCHIESDDIDLKDRNKARREDIAFVMQGNDLVGYLTVQENLKEAARIAGIEAAEEKILSVMDTVSLDVPLDQSSSLLSLGERQRLCIACALIRNPRMIILDEPTASLDHKNKTMVFELLRKLSEQGHYVVFTSHEDQAKAYADVIYRIEDRKLVIEKNDIHVKTLPKEPRQFGRMNMLKEHIRCFSRLNIGQMILNTSFIILITVLCGLAGVFTSVLLDTSRQELYESTDKYLYITDASNQGFLDIDMPCDHLPEGYPVYKVRMLEDDAYVIPYYDEMSFDGKVASRYSYEKSGMYVSHGAWEIMKNRVQFRSNMDLQLIIPEKGIAVWNGNYLGILKQGVRSYILESNEVYLSIYYKELEELCKSLRPCGIILFYTDIEDLEIDRQKYEDLGYTVNADSARYENILAFSQTQEEGYRHILAALFLLGAFMLGIADFVNLRRRSYELALLKSQGISPANIALMLSMENLPSIVISALITVVSAVVLAAFGLSAYLQPLMLSLIGVVIMVAGLHIINIIALRIMNSEKIFRD